MRRARSIEELSKDPAFMFHAQRLVGAAEMAAHWMQLQEDASTKAMGAKLADTVGYFFTDEAP